MSETRNDWLEQIVGVRMSVDNEFADRIAQSQFSSPQWELIMTAAEFEIQNPDDPEVANIVPDTSKLPQIMDDVQSMDEMSQYGTPAGSSSQSGFLSSLKSMIGLGNSSGNADREAAEQLLDEYANRLQSRLEEQGRWEEVCKKANTN
ncbi:MAG: DUF5799 family protein [Halobacteriaceae archaeon]